MRSSNVQNATLFTAAEIVKYRIGRVEIIKKVVAQMIFHLCILVKSNKNKKLELHKIRSKYNVIL